MIGGGRMPALHAMAIAGSVFSVIFMVLQLIPIPGLSGVCIGPQSYLLLAVRVVLGAGFWLIEQRKRRAVAKE